MMTSPSFYPICLLLISAAVLALESARPWRKDQKRMRPHLFSDLMHLVFNGHFLGVILFGIAAQYIIPHVDQWLAQANMQAALYRNIFADLRLWVQIPLALFLIDVLQWGVHITLHRVPFLWRFHQTHHSVVDGEMDFIVSFRFQWMEVVVYKTMLFMPMAWFGFSTTAIVVHAVFGTLIGHLNHANLNISWGPLRYLLNSPRMHIWHHDYDQTAGKAVNFGIIFSCWDWMFGTAYLPEGSPKRIGFPGVEEFPTDFLSQTAWLGDAWGKAIGKLQVGPWIARATGAALFTIGWWLH